MAVKSAASGGIYMKRTLCVVAVFIIMSIVGCSSPEYYMDIHAVYEEISDTYILDPMQSLDEATFEKLYSGMPMDKVVSFNANVALLNIRATEVTIIEASTEDAAGEIKTAVGNRLSDLHALWSAFLPDQFALVEGATLEVYGRYVVFIVGDFAQGALGIVEKNLDTYRPE